MLTERAPAAPPHGLAAIVATFGDPRPLMSRDGAIAPTWEVAHITRAKLPRPMRYGHSDVVRIPVHRALARLVREMMEEIDDLGLWDDLAGFGGSYDLRPTPGGVALSAHAWGIALDLVPMGAHMPEPVIAACARYGYSWGGPLDPEHFQFGTGYGLLPGHQPVTTLEWEPAPLPNDPAFRAA